MRCGRRRYCRAVAFDPDRLAPLRGDPATAGIFSDFDGTLSPIVADPELAEPLPGIVPLLEGTRPPLPGRRGRLGPPGRAFSPRTCLRRSCWPGCMAWKCSTMANSRPTLRPSAGARLSAPRPRAFARRHHLVCWSSRRALSVTCHYRANPVLEPQVTALAREVAATTGLVARPGRKSVELLPPIRADKGTVIRK